MKWSFQGGEKMKMIATMRALAPIVTVCTLILAMSMPLANAAEHLPSDDDVNGILKLCAIGRVQRFEGDLKGKIEIWKRGAEATGKASVEDLGALFQTIKPDPQSIELYKNYTACVKDNIGQYLMSRSSMLDADTVIKIVELQKYRPYLEAKLGPPAYVENYDNGIVEAGYSWKKIDLEIFYQNNMSIQYIFTMNDRSYKPNMENLCNCVDSANNTCLGCGNFLKYQGEPFSSNGSSKFFDYAELLYEGATVNNYETIFIGYSSYGAQYSDNMQFGPPQSSFWYEAAIQRKHGGVASRQELLGLNFLRTNFYPNSFTVRYSLTPDSAFENLPLVLEFSASRMMPND